MAVVTGVNQTQKEAALFGFLAADFDPHQKVFLAQRRVGFDVIGRDRTGSADELLRIFDVHQCSVQKLRTNPACKLIRPFLQIVAFWIFLFAHLVLFRISDFGFRISI